MPHPSDEEKRVMATFDVQARKDEEASAKEGRPIFKDIEYVEIRTPGDNLNIIHRPVKEDDKSRFPRAYAAFKARLAAPEVGLPLSEWCGIGRSQVEELAHFGCRTVEQLAEMTDTNARNVGGIIRLRDEAKAYLAKARNEAPFAKVAAESAAKDKRIALLETQLHEALSAIKELKEAVGQATYPLPPAPETKPKRKPGRPRKTPVAEG